MKISLDIFFDAIVSPSNDFEQHHMIDGACAISNVLPLETTTTMMMMMNVKIRDPQAWLQTLTLMLRVMLPRKVEIELGENAFVHTFIIYSLVIYWNFSSKAKEKSRKKSRTRTKYSLLPKSICMEIEILFDMKHRWSACTNNIHICHKININREINMHACVCWRERERGKDKNNAPKASSYSIILVFYPFISIFK